MKIYISENKRLWRQLAVWGFALLSLFACEQDIYRHNESSDTPSNSFAYSGETIIRLQTVLETMINQKFPDCLADKIKRADVLEALQKAMAAGQLNDLAELAERDTITITTDNITLTPDLRAGTLKVELDIHKLQKFEHTLKDLPRNLSPYYRVYFLLEKKLDHSRPAFDVTEYQVRQAIEEEPGLVGALKAEGYDPDYIKLETEESCLVVFIYRSALMDDDPKYLRLPPEKRRLRIGLCDFYSKADDTFQQRVDESRELLGSDVFVEKLSRRSIFGHFSAGSQPRKVLALRYPDHKPVSLYTGPAIALSFLKYYGAEECAVDDDGRDIRDPIYIFRLWQSEANAMFRDGLYLHPKPEVEGELKFRMNDEDDFIVEFGNKYFGDYPTLPAFKKYFDKCRRYRLKKQNDGSIFFESLEGGRDVVGYYFSPQRQVTKECLMGKKFILDNVKYDGNRDYPNYRFLIFRKETGRPAWEFQYHFQCKHKKYTSKGDLRATQTDTYERRECLYQDMEWELNPETGYIHAWVDNLDKIYLDYRYFHTGTVRRDKVESKIPMIVLCDSGKTYRRPYDTTESYWSARNVYYEWIGFDKSRIRFSLEGRISWSYTEQGQFTLKSRRWLNDQQPESWQGYGAFWFMDVDQNLEGLGESLPSAANMHFVRQVSLRPFEGQWADLWPGHE